MTVSPTARPSARLTRGMRSCYPPAGPTTRTRSRAWSGPRGTAGRRRRLPRCPRTRGTTRPRACSCNRSCTSSRRRPESASCSAGYGRPPTEKPGCGRSCTTAPEGRCMLLRVGWQSTRLEFSAARRAGWGGSRRAGRIGRCVELGGCTVFRSHSNSNTLIHPARQQVEHSPEEDLRTQLDVREAEQLQHVVRDQAKPLPLP